MRTFWFSPSTSTTSSRRRPWCAVQRRPTVWRRRAAASASAAVLGTGIEGLANELAEYGVKTVYAVEDPALEHYVADAYAQALANLAKEKGCDVVVATASAVGKDLLPRVAVRLDAGIACDITGINDDGTLRAADVRRQRDRHGLDRDAAQGHHRARHRLRRRRQGRAGRGREGAASIDTAALQHEVRRRSTRPSRIARC